MKLFELVCAMGERSMKNDGYTHSMARGYREFADAKAKKSI